MMLNNRPIDPVMDPEFCRKILNNAAEVSARENEKRDTESRIHTEYAG